MSELLNLEPYGPRRDDFFVSEMNALTQQHLRMYPQLRRIWRNAPQAESSDQLPFLHVGLFKTMDFRKGDGAQVAYGRTLESSSTSGSQPSRIPLDAESSSLQSRSVVSILQSYAGAERRPLLVVDSAASLRSGRALSARTAAAMSLRPMASDIYFLLADSLDPASILWDNLRRALAHEADLLVYGFTWILWQTWRLLLADGEISKLLAGRRITFLHSGGWKKLESIRVNAALFNSMLVDSAGPGSLVVDFYGLVEQVGIVYPLCEYGSRHVPVWADVIVRDPFTLLPLLEGTGQLALMNCLAKGAPCHSVLTEDLGRLLEGDCRCGRSGRRFELMGRIPNAEVRGCANV